MKQVEILYRHSQTSEKAIEKYLVKEAERRGMLCLKYSNQNMTGFPDRILLCKESRVIWVEVKSVNGRLNPIQKIRMDQLTEMGHLVKVVWSRKDVDELFNLIDGEL